MRFDELARGADEKLNTPKSNPVFAHACHHCPYRFSGAGEAEAECLECGLPLCAECSVFFMDVCPIAADYTTNSGLEIGPRAGWEQAR